MSARASKALLTIRDVKPNGEVDLLTGCDFPLKHIGAGAFRNVYEIIGVPDIVLKVPIGKDGLKHSRDEMTALKRIQKSKRKYLTIQQYMPVVHYFDSKSGLMVMDRYRPCGWGPRTSEKIKEIREAFEKLFGHEDSDIYGCNVGIGPDKKMKIIDLGLVCWGHGDDGDEEVKGE